MKYLQRRDAFLEFKKIELTESQTIDLFKKSEMINETFENDIPWGDSLIGRLINSTIRKAKIGVNTLRISRLAPQVENCLNEMLADATFTPEQKKEVSSVKFRLLLEEIIRVVKRKDKISNKLTILLGNKNNEGGLIDLTCDDIEKVENVEGKEELLKKLKDFKEALIGMRNTSDEPQSESEDDDEAEADEEETPTPDEPDSGQSGNVVSKDTMDQVKKLFKSILDLFKFYKNTPPPPPAPNPQAQKVKKWDGNEILIISQDKEKKGPGGDKKWNTGDDEFIKPDKEVPQDEVQIIIKNPVTNKFDKDSKIKIVKADEIEESVIFEAANPEVQNQIGAVKKRIGVAFSKNDFGNKENLLTKLYQLCEKEDKQAIDTALDLIKQIISLESKNGGVIKFQDLIKLNEDVQNAPNTEYNSLAEPVSALVRVIMAFKEKMEFLNNFEKSKEPLSNFIDAYNYFKKLFGGDTPDKPAEEKPSEEEQKSGGEDEKQSQEDTKSDENEKKEGDKEKDDNKSGDDTSVNNDNGKFKRYNYKILKGESEKVKNKFWELEEEIFNDKLKKGGNTKTGQGTRDRLLKKAKEIVKEGLDLNISVYRNFLMQLILEDVKGELDAIYEEWRNHFSEEDETKYGVDVKKARELQEASNKGESKQLLIDLQNKDQYDRLMEIMDLFRRAYNLYATQTIPSGRSGGRISIGTFNEYELIGTKGGSNKDWDQNANPGTGPWAAKKPFEKWRASILNIMKNQKYRKILANSKFSYGGEIQTEGAGKALLKFMNDMISLKMDYNEAQSELVTNYFQGEAKEKIQADLKPVEPGTRPIAEDDKGEKGDLNFMIIEPGFTSTDFLSGGQFLKTFAVIDIKHENENKKLIVFFDSVKRFGSSNYLLMKLHISKSVKQSIVNNYLSKTIEEKKLKLNSEIKFAPDQQLFVGVHKLEANKKFFKKGETNTIDYILSKNVKNEQSKKLEFTVTKDVNMLGYLKENEKGTQTQKLITLEGKASKLSTGDYESLGALFNNDQVKRNFGISS